MGDGVRADIVTQLLALTSERQVKLADAFRSFNLYVDSRRDEIAADIFNILENFQPRNYLGQLLRWKLVDKYRASSEVARTLSGGDTQAILRALKCDWFFEDLSDPEKFVNQEIPSYSLSTRLKVLNKYGLFLKNGQVGDGLYTCVKARYGTRTALALLPACTDNFIVDQLSTLKADLHPRIAEALYDKHCPLITDYLVNLAKSEDSARKSRLSQFNPVMGKLAGKNLADFFEIYDKSAHSVDVRLGRRPTKKIIKFEIDRITNDFEKYQRLFRGKMFFSRLSLEQFKRLYATALLPDKMSEFCRCSSYSSTITALSSVKLPLRSHVIVTAFSQKYGRQITDENILHNCQITLLPYLPEEAKVSWVERKLSSKEDSVEDQALYMAHLPTQLSIPKLKKLIESQSDATTRSRIVGCFLKTIKLNNEPSQLADVFVYFLRRFRNEVAKFREAIVREVAMFDKKLLAALSLEDWSPINEFINILKLNNEVSSYKYLLREMFSVQVNTFREKGGDVDACIRNYLEYELSDGYDLDSDVARLCIGTPSYNYCLEWFLREEPGFKWKENERRLYFAVQLFSNVADFNKDRTEGRVDLPNWIIDILNSIIDDPKTKSYTMRQIAAAHVHCPDPRIKAIPTKVLTCELACSWLRDDPSSVQGKIPIIMEEALISEFKSWIRFFRKCRLYDSYGIPSMIVKICRVTLKLENPEYDLAEDSVFLSASSQPKALQTLALFIKPSEYLATVKPYVPIKHKIEEYSEDLKALYDLQNVVCNPFVDFPKPFDCLPIVREFAKGDYLKSVVSILVGVCYKIPEKEILPILTEWIDCPVSLRKHLLRIIYKIAPLQESVKVFLNVFATEKNTSLRLVLFLMLRKIFVIEPVEENFNIFLPIIEKLTVEDEEALQKLFEIADIDDAFVSRYVARLWHLVGTEWAQVLPNGKGKISEMVVNRSLSLLDETLCDELLSYNLASSYPKSVPTSFLNAYLADSKSASLQITRLGKVLDWLKPLIADQWHQQTYDSGLPVCPIRSAVSQIVKSLADYCSRDVNFDVSPTWLLTELKASLSSVVKPEYFLAEEIVLDEAVLRRKKIQLSFDDAVYDSAMADMIVDYAAKYGDTYGHILVGLLSDLPCKPTFHRISALLVEKSSHRLVQLVAIGGLEHEPDDDQLPFYKKVIGELSKSGEPVVQAALHQLLKNLRYVSDS